MSETKKHENGVPEWAMEAPREIGDAPMYSAYRIDVDHERRSRWWATYNAALVGGYATATNVGGLTLGQVVAAAHKLAFEAANLAHGVE